MTLSWFPSASIGYFEQRADQVRKPAIVLDIDETSLSNWQNIKVNNFGFIKGGPCSEEPNLACGFDEWILKASAPAIPPTLEFFNSAIVKNVAVFFITGRRDSQRRATLWNLDSAGFQGWARLSTRPDDDHNETIVPFKSGERKKIENQGYTIIANVGDQQSDLDGGSAECTFKVPNPFYFIK
jgi:predicted secreted acid phosphatase